MGIAFVIRAIGSDLGGERTSLVSASPQQRNRALVLPSSGTRLRCLDFLATRREQCRRKMSVSKRVRSGGRWNSNLSPIIAEQRREPGGFTLEPPRRGSNSICRR